MRRNFRSLWYLGALFLLSACGGQETDFSNTVIGNNADYGAPSGEVTAIDPGDHATIRADISSVISVPYRQHDPTIPHPAYNGHPTTFKAISRGGCEAPYVRWDVDGNGTWDDCVGRIEDGNGWYQSTSRYDLDCRAQLPYVDPAQVKRKLFIATVEVNCIKGGIGSRFASYYVMVYADVPIGKPEGPNLTYRHTARPPVTQATCSGGTCAETGFPCSNNAECVGDTTETLKIKREVAIDDALWYLHKQMTRSGEGINTISGRIVAASSPANDAYVDGSAAFLHALALTGHFNAYPPGTYVHGAFGDVPALPPDWQTRNDQRYNTDPYAEDATRLMNFLLTYLTPVTVTAANEENDSRTPIPGTDNLSGLRAGNNSNMNLGQILAAFVANGSPGISVQTTGLAGHSMGYVAQEIIDAACYYQQTGAAASGGFYYGGAPSTQNQYWSPNTFAMYEGMASAEKRFTDSNLLISNACKHRVANHQILSTDGSGHTKLFSSNYPAPAWTGIRLLAAGWLGIDTLPYGSVLSFSPESAYTNSQLIDNFNLAKSRIGADWNTPAAHSNWRTGPANRFDGTGRGNVFAWVSFAKGARALNTPLSAYPGPSGDIDWLTDLSYIAVNSQHRDGFLYTDSTYDNYNSLAEFNNYYNSVQALTAWGIIHTLAGPLTDPVAFASADPYTVLEGCTGGANGNVTFSHGNSYHENPDRHIVDHRWLFEVTGNAADAFDAVDWDAIGDGEYSADGKAYHTTVKDATPTYTYQYDGTYTAALQVVDDATPAATHTMLLTITVTAEAEVAPTADAKGPYVMATGEPLMLNGTMSDGNSVCSPGDTLTAEWYLNDDTVPFFTGITGTLTWDELAALYPGLPDATPIPLVLKVTDGTGRTGESATTLTLGVELGPTACFSATPLTVNCGSAIAFDAGCSTHPHATRSIAIYEWQWDHDTDYVDQDPETFPFTADEEGVTAAHTYLAAGARRATLRLTDDHGLHGIAQKVVTVTTTTKPIAIPGGPYTIDEGQGPTLDGSGSIDPDIACGDSIATYAWDLDGDGLFDDCLDNPCVVSDAQSVAFGWHEGNIYVIRLRVTDSTGRVSDPAETTIRVESVCGNNFKAPSEECDDGNNEDGDCCDAGCSFETIGTLCGDGPTVCSAQDTCDGAGLCLPNHLPETNLCGDDEGPCVNQDTCGDDGNCHDNGFKPFGTPCTDDSLFCTGAETCDNGGSCLSEGDPCDTDIFCDEDIDACINTREVPCNEDNGNPVNSSDTIANVTITYTTAGGWTSPADCAWSCDTDYAEEGVSLDTIFDPDVNGDVWTIALQPDGKILLGGDFTAIDGVTRNHIARLNADGTLDTTFDPNANGTVYSIAVQPDGGILAGGAFTTIGGATRHYLARLGDDGVLDTDFIPEPNDWVTFIVAPADGDILVGGAFHTIGGHAMKFMARLNANGTADASFNPDLDSTVFFITTQSDGKILVGGTFTAAGVETRDHIARLNADGTLDMDFDPGEVNGDVYAIAMQADGKILMSGGFSVIGGETRNHLARLNADGTLDTTFAPNPDNYTVSIALQTDDKILASGFFTTIDGQARDRIARLNVDGTTDSTIDPDANDTVRFVAVQPDGKILAGGAFTAIGGQTRNHLARINPDALCINQKDVPCDDTTNPVNSTNTVANVTIHYTTEGGWEDPAACDWICDTDFAEEGGACINSKDVQCDEDNGNPVNSSDTIANVTITYTTAEGWTAPALCEWTCDTGFALEGGACINSKDVPCDEDNGNPVNSSDIIVDVTIHYTTAGGWEDPADCDWDCDTDFFLNGEETACVECLIDDHCGDGDACTGTETCGGGICNAGTPLVCADDNACTDNSCDPVTGCMVENNTDTCDDGSDLTENDVCFEGNCAGTLLSGVCGNAIPMGALPYTTTGTTAGRPSALTLYGDSCVADSQPAGDIVYELAVEEGVEYQIHIIPGTGVDLALDLIGTCGENEACLAAVDSGSAGKVELLNYTAQQTGTVHIVIEGGESGDTGPFELNVAVVEQPDEDTVGPDDIADPDEDASGQDEVVTDEMTLDDVATDDTLIDEEETDDDPEYPEPTGEYDAFSDDNDPQTDDAAPTDEDTTVTDTAVVDNEIPDETGDELLGDEDTFTGADTGKPADDGCGCSIVF